MSARKSKPPPDAQKVSEAVERTKIKAEEYARDPEKAKKLIDEALKKAKKQEKDKGPLAEVWKYLTASIRLLRAYIRHEYTDIPWGSIVLITVAIIYFVSPIDLIPDFIPVLGYVDDAAVIALVIAQVKADLDNFLQWEDEHKEAEQDTDE